MPRIDDRIRHETLNRRINWKADSPLYVGKASYDPTRSARDKQQLEALSNNERIDKRTAEGRELAREKEVAQNQLRRSEHLADRYSQRLSRSDARKFNIRESNKRDAELAANAWNNEQRSKGHRDIELYADAPDESVNYKSPDLKRGFLTKPRKYGVNWSAKGTQSIEDTADFADRLKEATKQADLLNKLLNKYL